VVGVKGRGVGIGTGRGRGWCRVGLEGERVEGSMLEGKRCEWGKEREDERCVRG